MDAWQFVVLLGLVIVGFAIVAPRKKRSDSTFQTSFIKEIEETVEHFVSEIEVENRELLKVLGDLKKDHEAQLNKTFERMEMLEKRTYDLSLDLSKQMQRLDQQNVL